MAVRDRFFYQSLFVLVLIVNAVLRFHQIGTFSLSNDELSAIIRLDYGTFIELIRHGVIETDPHPAGVQLFMYLWHFAFGTGPLAMRLPFVICGLLALVMLYALFRRWFGAQNALIAVAFFSLLEFSIIHGQLARPYAIGIFTCAGFVLIWDDQVRRRDFSPSLALGYVAFGVACTLTHYFAALFAGLVGIAGLVPAVRNGIAARYAVLNLAIIAGFMAHLPITVAQFSRNDLTSWIQPEGFGFFRDHIWHLLNESVLLVVLFVGCLVTGLIFIRKNSRRLPYFFLSLFLALSPVLIALIYAQFRENVLMDRVLYFFSPFLIALAFAHLPGLPKKYFLVLFAGIVIVVSVSTVFGRRFTEHRYVENFKDIAGHIAGNPERDIICAGNFNSDKYLAYYLGNDLPEFAVHRIGNDRLLAEYMQVVRHAHSQFLSLSWACTYQPIEAVEYGKRYFPNPVESGEFFNSGFWLMEKSERPRPVLLFRKPEIHAVTSREEYVNIASFGAPVISDLEVLNIFVRFDGENVQGIKLVWEIKGSDGTSISWRAKDMDDFYLSSGDNELMASIKLPTSMAGKILQVYFWNPQFGACTISDLEISSYADSHYPNLY